MDATLIILLVALVTALILAGAFFYRQASKSRREKRGARLTITELDEARHLRYADEWQSVQARFVNQPAGAVNAADDLCQRVLLDRGYPLAGFAQQAAIISVDHPQVVSNYRAAHAIAIACHQGYASTEDLRTAMSHYRVLFADLLGAVPVTG